MARCRSCGAPIQWVRTVNGKSMPLDDPEIAELGGRGNLIVERGVARVVTTGEGDRISHFATCPQAASHRR